MKLCTNIIIDLGLSMKLCRTITQNLKQYILSAKTNNWHYKTVKPLILPSLILTIILIFNFHDFFRALWPLHAQSKTKKTIYRKKQNKKGDLYVKDKGLKTNWKKNLNP